MINDLTINVSGNIGREPELRYTRNGIAVLSFSVAHTKRWRNRDTDEQQEKTTWVKVTAWGKVAEALKNEAAKGDRIIVLGGTPDVEAWTDNSGQTRTSLVVNINDFNQFQIIPKGERSDSGSADTDFINDVPF